MTLHDAIPFCDGDAIRAALPMDALLDAVEAAFRDVASGRDRSPVRTHVGLPDGDLLMMPGIRDGAAGMTVKLVTVMPANAARGLPTVQAIVVWFDAATGRPQALLDGPSLTAMRTGAASGVATRLLARPDASMLALLGAGAQAEWQVRAVVAARPIRRVSVYTRTEAHRTTFADRMSKELGIEVAAAGSAEEAVRSADVVCCATTSSTPVLEAGWVAPGTHVNAIGAFRLGMIELPAELFAAASLVTVDARTAALAEAGDVVAAIEGGQLVEGSLVEIGSVSGEYGATRDPNATTIFKSVGLAIQDVAAAELVVERMLGG